MLNRKRSRGTQGGLSMVELMVGVAVGLFVVAGATVAVSNQLGDNRRLMLETQIQQDLRATADLIAKDLRRAGYWGAAEAGVWHAATGLPILASRCLCRSSIRPRFVSKLVPRSS